MTKKLQLRPLAASAALLLTSTLYAETWLQDHHDFRTRLQNSSELLLDADGLLSPQPGTGPDALYTSPVLKAKTGGSLQFAGWITNMPVESRLLSVELRGSPNEFPDTTPASDLRWLRVDNGQTNGLPQGRFFQYRIRFRRDGSTRIPNLREILLSTVSLTQKLGDTPRPPIENLSLAMMYSATPEKLWQFYGKLDYNASERGIYILRNREGQRIEKDTYHYIPNGPEMYLPARFGTWILVRIHPEATFSPLTLRPKDVIVRSKSGDERSAPHLQYRAINFFDEAFMQEYVAGVRAAVRFYRDNNPYVFGYNIMPPEFFYDCEPWPQMTHMGGFGDDALRSWRAFMANIGEQADQWPAGISDGRVSHDPRYYLWAYWRYWAGANYINTVASAIKEEDSRALVGSLSYVGDQGLRGGEAAFIERNPNLDFYYSSNMFPRVPGPDGWNGGTVFSYTRLNLLGYSSKKNFLEFDVWSPYVDMQRAAVHARYAQIENLVPVPIVFGDYPAGKASNHLTRYHGMTGSPMTPEVFGELRSVLKTAYDNPQGYKKSDVAYILPSISLLTLLEKDAWKSHRYVQQQHHILGVLLKHGVTFDLLTEGHVSKDVLDKYRLVIVTQPGVFPWMKDALDATSAHILATGIAGTLAAPGPRHLGLSIAAGDFSKALASAWPDAPGEMAGSTIFASGGKVVERDATIHFASEDHPLLRDLKGLTLPYSGKGLSGGGLPYVAGQSGQPLARDDRGAPVFSVTQHHGKHVIHTGTLLWFKDANDSEKAFFDDENAGHFWANIFDFLNVQHYHMPKALHVMRTTKGLLVENITSTPYTGPRPESPGGQRRRDQATIQIPAYATLFLEDENTP